MNAAPILAAALALAAAPALAAQSLALRFGGFRASYADSLHGTAGSSGADLAWSGARGSIALTGTASAFDGGGWALQGAGTARARLSSGARHELALAADAAGSSFTGGAWVGTATAGPTVTWDAGAAVLSASAAAGGVRRLDGTGSPLVTGGGGLARSFGPWRIAAWGAASAAGALRYGDVGAALGAEWRFAALEARAGRRLGDLGAETWAQVRGSVRLAAAVWLEAAGGRYPRDVTGFLHGSFVQAGLRFALARRGHEPAAPLVRRAADGAVTARFTLPDTGTVRIAGEWNGWSAQPLRADGRGAWLLRAPLAPGVYRFSLIRADGGWTVPAGVPSVTDDFGGTVGLLVVPE